MSQSDDQVRSSGELLRRGLALGDGFALYVVAAEQLATREAFVRSLGESPTLALALVDVAELANAAIDRPIDTALRKLAADRRRHVVVVIGLEELAERVPELMARLNEYRNELRARIDGALVLLGTPVLLRLVQHQAPDVWSARAADLELDEERPSWRPAERALARARAAGLEDANGDTLAAARTAVQQLDEDAVDPELAARAWSDLARTCLARGHLDEADEASSHALRLAGRLGADEVRAEILAERAEQLTSRGRLSEGLELWDEALALPQSEPVRLGALARAGITAALAGRRDRLGHYWRRYLAQGGQPKQLEAEIDALETAAAALAREMLSSPAPARSTRPYLPGSVDAPAQHERGPDLSVARVVMSPRGGYELVAIPGGRFVMGSPDDEPGHRESEGPRHQVELSGFYLGRHQVTNAQYEEFLRCNPEAEEPRYWGDRRFNHPRQPVVGVSWWDARSFCEWAGLSLPTEAQWEYACRAGTTTRYWSGDGEEDLARADWYGEDPVTGATHPVGEKAPNSFGLYDMHGNVHEWCEDAWSDTFAGSMPRAGDGLRAQPIGARSRVVRGGSWIMPALGARSAYRYGRPPHYRSFDVGFRPALLHG